MYVITDVVVLTSMSFADCIQVDVYFYLEFKKRDNPEKI